MSGEAVVPNIRLIPIVAVAALCLLALKAAWLLTGPGPDGRIEVVAAAPAPAATTTTTTLDVTATGSGGGHKKPDSAIQHPAAKAAPPAGPPGQVVPNEPQPDLPSAGERVLLQRLQERRQELEARARELDMRESMLKAAEGRLDQKLEELKALEAQAAAGAGKREDQETQKLKGLITMYESMRAKDAARIFDRLELGLLVDVVKQMNPRKMADILGQMSTDAAERLSSELARRERTSGGGKPGLGMDLPKIDGRRS